MKTYYISRKTCRDFSVFLTLQTIFKEQKKGAEEEKWGVKRRDKWTNGKQSAVRVFGEHTLRPKGAERSIFWARRCKYETWPLLQTRQSQSSSLQPRLHSEHTRCKQSVQSVCECVDRIHKRSLCCISTCTNHNLFVLWDASYYLSDLRFHYWRAENPTRDLTFAHRAADAPARVRSAESAVYVKPDTSVSSYYPSHLSPLPSSSLLYNPLLICAPPRTVCCQ